MPRFGNNKFKTEYCTTIIDMFSQGKSLADFCVEVGCGRKTVYEWIDRSPTFADAYSFARECGKSFRDNQAIVGMHKSNEPGATNFDSATYLKLTQQRWKDMEREAPEIKLFDDKQNPDLFKAIIKLAELTANEDITVEHSRQMTAIIATALGVKEGELLAGRVEEMSKQIKELK